MLDNQNERFLCEAHNAIVEQQNKLGLSDDDLEDLIQRRRNPPPPQKVPPAPSTDAYNNKFPRLTSPSLPKKAWGNAETCTSAPEPKPLLLSTESNTSEEEAPQTIIFERQKVGNFKMKYSFTIDDHHTLGVSTHSCVYAGHCDLMGTKSDIAVKVWQLPLGLQRAKDVTEQLKSEYSALLRVKTNHVVRMIDYLEMEQVQGAKCALLIMERCKSDLSRYLQDNKNLSENVKRSILQQLLIAYRDIHASNVRHLDVKPENILIDEIQAYPGPFVKLCDFAFSKVFEQNQQSHSVRSFIGTIDTKLKRCWVSPEMIMLDDGSGVDGSEGISGLKADIWSLGCVLYFLEVNYAPFKTKEEVRASRDNTARLSFLQRDNIHLSHPLLFDLIERMTKYYPEQRISLKSAICHPVTWSKKFTFSFIKEISDDKTRNDVRILNS